MLGLGYSRASAGAVSKNQDKNWGRYDSKTGAGRLQVTHAPSYQISSMERRVVEISQNINPFQSALSLSLSLSTRPGLIKKSIFLISFPIDVWEWVQFPKSKILVFCECSEVGLIGKLDLQKGRVFGLNNQSSDRHRDITTQNTTFITRNWASTNWDSTVQPTANINLNGFLLLNESSLSSVNLLEQLFRNSCPLISAWYL